MAQRINGENFNAGTQRCRDAGIGQKIFNAKAAKLGWIFIVAVNGSLCHDNGVGLGGILAGYWLDGKDL